MKLHWRKPNVEKICGICGKVVKSKRLGRTATLLMRHVEKDHTSEERQQYLSDNKKLQLSEAFDKEHSVKK